MSSLHHVPYMAFVASNVHSDTPCSCMFPSCVLIWFLHCLCTKSHPFLSWVCVHVKRFVYLGVAGCAHVWCESWRIVSWCTQCAYVELWLISMMVEFIVMCGGSKKVVTRMLEGSLMCWSFLGHVGSCGWSSSLCLVVWQLFCHGIDKCNFSLHICGVL